MTLDSRFKNDDLVLEVSSTYNIDQWTPDRYEPFLDALCGSREYQKEAIREALRFYAGGQYTALADLAEENFLHNDALQRRYGEFSEMRRRLSFPERLACNIDLATGTGKSYVMYGLARILLAEGLVDRVLVLTPSVTIERGLLDKFRTLSADPTLRDVLPSDAAVSNPHIIDGTSSITPGDICIENFHATLAHVRSSLRDSLAGSGSSTLVLNDEVHHLFTPGEADLRKWKEFVDDPQFNFRFVGGFSGTCYSGDDYFSDVIFRYSLREAIADGTVKSVDYVSKDESSSPSERFQKIRANHEQNRSRYARTKPLTVFVTQSIAGCKRLASEFVDYLEASGLSRADAESLVLVVTSAREHRDAVRRLQLIDTLDDPAEFVISVSMLTEGWDVQNVFQIVPHEERAFNSKLLIAQVLGRGLRVPAAYSGQRPVVTVFNHHAWSSRIDGLVREVLEIEHRVVCVVTSNEPRASYHFVLQNIDYTKEVHTEEFTKEGEYEFSKGYVQLASQVDELERETTYSRALTGAEHVRQTRVRYQMHPVDEVARHIHNKLKAIDLEAGTEYAKTHTRASLTTLIRTSLRRVGEESDVVSEENRQRLQRAFGVVHRGASRIVRYRARANALLSVPTEQRPKDSVGYSALRRGEASVFFTASSESLSDASTAVVLRDAKADLSLPRSALFEASNETAFRVPTNVVLANHGNEYLFTQRLLAADNARHVTAWMKSTDRGFYSIEYSFRRGEHPKRGQFSPDYFIVSGDEVLVVEIKGDEQLQEASPENVGKYRAAIAHFELLNELQSDQTYYFGFLTPSDFDAFFRFLRDGKRGFTSHLDVALSGGNSGSADAS